MPLANTARSRLVNTDDLESSLTAVLFDDRHIFAVFENMVVQSEQRFIIVFGVSIVVEERTVGGGLSKPVSAFAAPEAAHSTILRCLSLP